MNTIDKQEEALRNLSTAISRAYNAGLVLGVSYMYGSRANCSILMNENVMFDERVGFYIEKKQTVVDK